ncbi:uncharacterized protein UTRI_10403_B [Ustilago trichophora]|uniref:Uncharacterized protein n=1 Tax=Ustilago trichophora TaxID=86804 RepID=A0A5C3EA83_9BASI|nr:uncharacterized protein UTRI_10403_B [Ustilago trichophora]
MRVLPLPSWIGVSIGLAAACIHAIPMYRLFPPGNDAAMASQASSSGGQGSSGLDPMINPDRGGLRPAVDRLPSDSELEAAMTANPQTVPNEPRFQHIGMGESWNQPQPTAGNNEMHRVDMTAYHQFSPIEPHFQHAGMGASWNYPLAPAGYHQVPQGGMTAYHQVGPIEPYHPLTPIDYYQVPQGDMRAYHVGPIEPQFQHAGMGASWSYPMPPAGYHQVPQGGMTTYHHIGPIEPYLQHAGMGEPSGHPWPTTGHNEVPRGDMTAHHLIDPTEPHFQHTGTAGSSIPTSATAGDSEVTLSGGTTVPYKKRIKLPYGSANLQYTLGGDKFKLQPYPDDHEYLRFNYIQGQMTPSNFEKYIERDHFGISESIFRPEPDLMKAIQAKVTGALLGQHIALVPPGPGVTVNQGVFLWPPVKKHHTYDNLWMQPQLRQRLYQETMSKWSEHSQSTPKYWYLQVDDPLGTRHIMMNAVDSTLFTELPNENRDSPFWVFHEAMVDTKSLKPKMALIGGMFLPSVSTQALQLGGAIRPAISHL